MLCLQAVEQDGAAGLLASLGITKSAEQRAQEAAEKERKRKDKLARKDKKTKEKQPKEAVSSPGSSQKVPRREGPARPVKPAYREESYKAITNILSGSAPNVSGCFANLQFSCPIPLAIVITEFLCCNT